jgi:hypothetical protein
MSSSSAFLSALKALALSGLLFACNPKIGDDCSTSTDCSSSGTRSCDTKMPGGYCTVFNCEPDSCPGEAACIGFVLSVSTLLECANPGESRELRTFCMRRCSNDGDCRSGYKCINLNEEGNAYSSALVDKKRSSGWVCALEYAAMPAVDERSVAVAEYCTAGTFVDDGYYDLSTGGQGSGGQGSGGQGSGGQGSAGEAGASQGGGSSGSSTAALGGGASGGSSSAATAGTSL